MPLTREEVRQYIHDLVDEANRLFFRGETMIRCVPFDYFGRGRPDHVAFFDTVTDRFVEFGDEQAWGSKREFEACVVQHTIDPGFVKRLLDLTPMWFWDNHEEREFV